MALLSSAPCRELHWFCSSAVLARSRADGGARTSAPKRSPPPLLSKYSRVWSPDLGFGCIIVFFMLIAYAHTVDSCPVKHGMVAMVRGLFVRLLHTLTQRGVGTFRTARRRSLFAVCLLDYVVCSLETCSLDLVCANGFSRLRIASHRLVSSPLCI